MIGIFSRTTELYDALANETRLSILILLKAKKEMDSEDLRDYLGEESIETLEHHLNVLERVKLIQKRDSSYSLTKEGERRLSELGVTESEAIELTKEREILIESTSQNEVGSAILDAKTIRLLSYPEICGLETLKNSGVENLEIKNHIMKGCTHRFPPELTNTGLELALYRLNNSVFWHDSSRLVSKSIEEEITHED